MRLIFDHRMLEHINQSAVHEKGHASRALLMIEALLSRNIIILPLAFVEHLISLVLNFPLPIYSSLIYRWVTYSRGLPHIGGMYLRALYYRNKLGFMASNVFIDQGVFFANPKNISLDEFCYIDKSVMLMARSVKIGKRVHIAPNVFISGGGDFEIDDYACIATGSSIITSTEVLKGGARCSGPMVKPEQRNVLRGKVIIKKDAFVGANVTVLPNVVMEEGSVAAAGITLSKSTKPWGIYAGLRPELVGAREPVKWGSE